MSDGKSTVELVKHGKRETTTHLLTTDEVIIYGHRTDGGMTLEFTELGTNGKPLKGYRLVLCPEDAERIRKA